ncbi:MAG: DEAD/DEAH box helicase [Gammaproteobacteria bacterium]|nr:DEAD/DEAH box helicase [Gammaproteobacteria bacterium]
MTETSKTETPAIAFKQLVTNPSLLKVLNELGYEHPTPIQAETIPLIAEGHDVLGQAQTGTGKTAAFALPLLANLNLKQKEPQILVLAPTRELAIQVAEAFQRYASYIKDFHVIPIYGGQDYTGQIRALRRGVHVVVGTPGRVMDHMRKGTLQLHKLSTLVLDEADEMLRMGFIDDVEWILEQCPEQHQTALFSATMPKQIRHIAEKYLNEPKQITIKVKTSTAETIRQRYWPVSGVHKLDALTRILEAETFDGIIVFVRTRIVTVELAEKLSARGYAASALNGDIPQNQRERTIQKLKQGKIDILVATDVAARGLDVERISHVINYDVPYDTEAYVHRIGRTGRAGREGDAILFVAPRERRMLQAIERATRSKIELMELPSTEIINNKRIAKFKQDISDTLASEDDLKLFRGIIEQYEQEHNVPAMDIATALAKLLRGDKPLLLKKETKRESKKESFEKRENEKFGNDRPRSDKTRSKKRTNNERFLKEIETGMQRYRIEVGHEHKVKPGNIIGAIANEAEIESKHIGRINIFEDYSVVDLPEGMPKEILQHLKNTFIGGKKTHISEYKPGDDQKKKSTPSSDGKSKKKPNRKPRRAKVTKESK